MSNLGKLFKEIRLSKKWSIRQAAKKMGISYSYLSILKRVWTPHRKGFQSKAWNFENDFKGIWLPLWRAHESSGIFKWRCPNSKKFDHDIFVKNILLIMGNMTAEEFSDDIYQKTGYQSSLPR